MWCGWIGGLVVAVGLAGAGHAEPENIADVLARSQSQRLAHFDEAEADDPRALVVQASFDAVRLAMFPRPNAELRVIRGGTVIAETLQGRIVVANRSLADLPEAARRFVLAHELGHVALGHWQQTGLLYQKWVPGAVTPQHTEPVAALLGHEASDMAHRQEFEADAFAARTLRTLGQPTAEVLPVFMQLGVSFDTPTHPGTRRRIAALRARGLNP